MPKLGQNFGPGAPGSQILETSIFDRKCPKLTKYWRGRGTLILEIQTLFILPGIQGIALILSQAVQQTEATQRVQTKLNRPNCPKICALVPTLQKDHYLPATFPNELEFNRTERQFITTVGDVPNELVIVGNKTLEVPDFDQVFGARTSATICTADSFCNETADYPVETLYMDKTSLYFAKFEKIERDEPLPRRQQQVLMPRMPCYTGQRAGHRIALPQPEADMLNHSC